MTTCEAGRLRHRVTIEQLTAAQNTFGEEEPRWQSVTTRWASIAPLSGRELFTAQQVYAEATHGVRLRYLAGLTPKMRLVYRDRVFNIESIRNADERRAVLDLIVTEAR
jgi:SPP1 family predicted phage head-tail adaptor